MTRSTAMGSVAPTAILTGGALALVGTTLPWARVTDQVGTFYLVRLADLGRVTAPVATLWLVLAVGGALAGRGSSPWAAVTRVGIALFATVGAFFLLGQTVFLAKGATVLAHAAITDNPSLVTVGRVLPEVGCLLYVVGLMLVALGAVVVEVATRGLEPEAAPPGGRPALHRVVVVLALILAVVSAVLPWYTNDAAGFGLPSTGVTSPPGRDDAQAWLGLYRAGLAACLAITVLALVLRRQAPRLRLLGLIVGVAVSVMLLSGYATLWRRPTLQYATDRIGAGYHLGFVAMLLLTASFAALPSGPEEVPSDPEPPSDVEEVSSDPEEAPSDPEELPPGLEEVSSGSEEASERAEERP
jgi:hypothetical protein